MSVFEKMTPQGYEQVLFCHDPGSGLRSIIAIHDTTLGPALGGVRMHPYPSEDAALEDCLRLARAMTFKAATAGLHLGGAKSVIIGDPRKDKTEALIRAHGRFIRSLGGRYIPGLDVGTEREDMQLIAHEGARVTCEVGDPSTFTALGVVICMRAALQAVDGDDRLEGRTVTVQGVGHVGQWLVKMLREHGARVLFADLDAARVEKLAAETGAEPVAPEEILTIPADVFAPCAMGDVVTSEVLPKMKCRIIAGAANNPLALGVEEEVGPAGVVFVPDFIANSGGLMRLEDILVGYDEEHTTDRVQRLTRTVHEIIDRSSRDAITTYAVAQAMGQERIDSVRRLGPSYLPPTTRSQEMRLPVS